MNCCLFHNFNDFSFLYFRFSAHGVVMENISTSQPSYILHLPGTSAAYNDANIDDPSSYLL